MLVFMYTRVSFSHLKRPLIFVASREASFMVEYLLNDEHFCPLLQEIQVFLVTYRVHYAKTHHTPLGLDRDPTATTWPIHSSATLSTGAAVLALSLVPAYSVQRTATLMR